MRRLKNRIVGSVGLVLALATAGAQGDEPWLKFEPQEIDPHVGEVCYALTTADINADGKPDIVAVSEDAVVWYENPSWEKRDIIRGVTERDNVCIAAHDIDGDGRVDLALGAGWKPPNTQDAGTLQWLGRDTDGKWEVHPIRFEEPSIHRIRWGDVTGDGKAELVVVPLQGRGTKGPDWGAGEGVQIKAFSIPEDPKAAEWPSELIDDSLHATHNFQLLNLDEDPGLEMVVGGREGVFQLDRNSDSTWSRVNIGTGYQGTDRPNKGVSEIKRSKVGPHGQAAIATIEPWHGDLVVVYLQSEGEEWKRYTVASGLSWGHAVWFANLDGQPGDELIIGQRDPRKDEQSPKGPGVLVFGFDTMLLDGATMNLSAQHVVDDGGMACEDALAEDLDGDGLPEVVAGGRATHNVKIYWNKTGTGEKAR